MARRWNDAQIFDLLILGLSWVQQATRSKKISGWTANGVLDTIHRTGCIENDQYRFTVQRSPQSLRDYTISRSHLLWPKQSHGNGPKRREKLPAIREQSDKLVVVLVDTQLFYGDKLFAPRGYRLMLTNQGLQYAQEVAGTYSTVLPCDSFRGSWNTHARSMAAMYVERREG